MSTQPAAPRLGRRQALRVLTASGAALGAGAASVATAEPLAAPPQALGMLYDTTLCIGCKTCVAACREANNLEADRSAISGVNLDEEAAKLIQYQQAYQASAKLLQIAQNIFDNLIQTMSR